MVLALFVVTGGRLFLARRAHVRLAVILKNLKRIDVAAEQYTMEHSAASGGPLSRPYLDGTGGDAAYLEWPSGPVVGTYSITDEVTPATFDGGNTGARTSRQWQTSCSEAPQSCGL